MSASIEGLQELIDKLEGLTDEKFVTKVQKQALKPEAESILKQMQGVTPVSTRRNIHGIDAEGIVAYRYNGAGGYQIGISNMNGHGTLYWEQIKLFGLYKPL